MKRVYAVLALLALVGALPTRGNALEVVQNDTGTLNIEGYGQWLGVYESVPDDKKGFADRAYEFLKEARLQTDGTYGDVKYNVMYAIGPEEAVETQSGSTSNSALGLQDFSADIPMPALDNTWLKVGQFLVPYGRENLTDDRTMNFDQRSVESLGFDWNRDVGAALSNYTGKFAGTLAIVSGGGIDYPQRYLPEKLGFPMTVLRVGYNDGVDKDIYNVNARDDNPNGFLHRDNANAGGTETAVYVNGMYMRDSDVGHSTVLNVRADDKPLLIDPDYNPFIAMSAAGPQSYSLANIYQLGGDAVYRAPFIGGSRFNSEVEYDYGHFDNEFGSLNIKGARAQAGVSEGKWEANARYSILYLDPHMEGNPGIRLLDNNRPINEVTPSLTYHYRPNVQVVGTLPIFLDMPVFQDPVSGNYVMAEQPDQSTYDKGGSTVARRNIMEARLMIQFAF